MSPTARRVGTGAETPVIAYESGRGNVVPGATVEVFTVDPATQLEATPVATGTTTTSYTVLSTEDLDRWVRVSHLGYAPDVQFVPDGIGTPPSSSPGSCSIRPRSAPSPAGSSTRTERPSMPTDEGHLPPGPRRPVRIAQTNTRGAFTFANPRPGTYKVSFSDELGQYAGQW